MCILTECIIMNTLQNNLELNMNATPKQATTEQMTAALETAYLAQGVKGHSVVGGMFVSPSQHQLLRAKALLTDASQRLERRGLEHTLKLVYPEKGDRMYGIAFSA
jgi:hypothetical protein